MIYFRDLSDIDNDQILDCFNDSFSDYIIPINLNIAQLESKLYSESINKSISVGAFNDERLVGFVLHGDRLIDDVREGYNAGTGVRPKERGQGLTIRMYDYIIPKLKSCSVEKVSLEVIENNVPAIRAYEKIGFKYAKDLICYKVDIQCSQLDNGVEVVASDKYDLSELGKFGELEPSWQNSNETIERLKNSVVCLLAYFEDELCGYGIVHPEKNKILQMAVKSSSRRKGVGSAMLEYIKDNISNSLAIINVDAGHKETRCFLVKRKFKKTLTQREMVLHL